MKWGFLTMKYNEAIKKVRLKMCLTQTEFGTLFGVTFGTVNRWEAGTHEPTMEIKEDLLDSSLENISPSLVGETVDYMTRFMLNHNRNSSFEVSRLGARLIGFEDYFQGLLEEIRIIYE